MLRIINGKGTRSYRSCINPKCNNLPIAVLKGRLKDEGFETQVPYCRDDKSFAFDFVRERFNGVGFTSDTRDWIRKRQEEESRVEFETVGKQFMERAIKDQIQSRSRRRSED